ncbi:MAG TPA: hypothetical protein VI306_20525 [Pyrinomonadaceae bacterium]
MYCPQCGTDSASNLQFCRGCGANLKVIGKAVALSEAVARSDRGPLPKIKEMVKNFKVEQVTEEVSRALEHMNTEIARMSPPEKKQRGKHPWISSKTQKTPAQRREEHITKGIVSMFSGVGLMIFLYYLSGALVLKLPPHIIEQIPFEIEPVVRVIWLLGVIPTLTGLGNIMAGLLIKPKNHEPAQLEEPKHEAVEFPKAVAPTTSSFGSTVPRSVIENTTNLLEEKAVR